MATWTYDEALRRLLAHEGGYTNHPSDPGGPTNFGITIHDYRKYVKSDATSDDIRRMSRDDAKAIYRAKYWDAQRCDDLPAGLDYAIFDYGVNSGIGRSGKVLRRLFGLPDDTSVVTVGVCRAASRIDVAQSIARLCDERLDFLKRLKTWPVFGRGWERRVREVRGAALAMAAQTPQAVKPASRPSVGKGVTPLNTGAQAGTAGSIIITGAFVATQSNSIGTASIILVVAAACAIAAALYWKRRQRRAQES